MKRRSIAAALIAGFGAGAGLAQSEQNAASSSMIAPAEGLTRGEIRSVDRSAAKLTIRHDAIIDLDMPPMTMAYAVVDPTLLNEMRVGQKIRFAAAKLNGVYVVTRLQASD